MWADSIKKSSKMSAVVSSTRGFIYEQPKWPSREESFSKPWLHYYNGIQYQHFKEMTKISLCGDRHNVHNAQSRGKL